MPDLPQLNVRMPICEITHSGKLSCHMISNVVHKPQSFKMFAYHSAVALILAVTDILNNLQMVMTLHFSKW